MIVAHQHKPGLKNAPNTCRVVAFFHFVQAHEHLANARKLAPKHVEEIAGILTLRAVVLTTYSIQVVPGRAGGGSFRRKKSI